MKLRYERSTAGRFPRFSTKSGKSEAVGFPCSGVLDSSIEMKIQGLHADLGHLVQQVSRLPQSGSTAIGKVQTEGGPAENCVSCMLGNSIEIVSSYSCHCVGNIPRKMCVRCMAGFMS